MGDDKKKEAQATINEKVYDWSRLQLNKRVGRGQCWDLADRALRHAGARSSATTGDDDNYDWGTPVIPVTSAIRGDILQFRNFVVKTTITTENTSDGSSEAPWKLQERPHHTAIVAANNSPKGMDIFEQNSPKGAPVRRSVIYVTNTDLGTTTEQRKVNGRLVVFKITTTVEVTGNVWAYRPEAKK